MNFKKNKTLVTIVVLFVAIGLVLAYVPLLFAPSGPDTSYYPEEEQSPEIPATAQIGASANTDSMEDGESTEVSEPAQEQETDQAGVTEEETQLPDSFSGLEEESSSLDDLLNDF